MGKPKTSAGRLSTWWKTFKFIITTSPDGEEHYVRMFEKLEKELSELEKKECICCIDNDDCTCEGNKKTTTNEKIKNGSLDAALAFAELDEILRQPVCPCCATYHKRIQDQLKGFGRKSGLRP